MDVQQTLELVRKSLAAPDNDILKTAGWAQPGSATTGLTAYNLEAPAKLLYPVLTPLRNEIPRVVGQPGVQANWRNITGINTTGVRLGVGEGERGAALTHTTSDKYAAFLPFGLEDYVSFEAQWSSKNFDDAKARAVEGLLQATMIQEEGIILGGNATIRYGSSGVCPTPTVTLNTDSTSSVTSGTLLVKCVALGWHGYWALAGMNNGTVGSSLGLTLDPGDYSVFTKTNVDGTSDTYPGNIGAISSASSGVTIDGSHKSAACSVTATAGAFGYAWYASPNGGTYYLFAITTLNSTQITADPTTSIGVASALTTDRSRCTYEFDGLLSQALTSGSGAYVQALATGTAGTGTKLTTDGAGGIAELNTMFADRWNLYRLSIDELWVNAQQLLDINTLVIKNGGAPLIRFNMDGTNPSQTINAGVAVGSLLNKITGTQVRLRVHPNMPPGAMLGRCMKLPYKLSGINDVYRMLLRQDYYSVEWPLITRKWTFGTYFDGVLQCHFAPALSVIFNIAPGV